MTSNKQRYNKSVKVNAVLNTVKTISGIIFPLITFPYVSRVLSVESMGVYSWSSSIINYFTLLASLGISTYAIREGTQYRENNEEIRIFSSDVFTINIFSTLLSYLLLILTILCVPKIRANNQIVMILSIEILFSTIGVNWLCNIYEDFTFVAIRSIAFQVLSLVLTFVFVKSSEDIFKYVVIVVIASSGANLLNFFYIRKKYVKFSLALSKTWIRHLKPILVIFSTTVTITLYVSSDITILGFLTDNIRVGYYNASVKIYTIIKNVMISIVVVLVPRFSILFSNAYSEDVKRLLSKVVDSISVLLLPVMVGLFMVSSDAIELVAGVKYMAASDSLRILSIATLFSLYAYLFVNCIMIPQKKEAIILYATLISAVVNVALNFLLIPRYGINAAAFTTVIAEMIIFFVSLYSSRHYLKFSQFFHNIWSVILGCIGIVLVCKLSSFIPSFYVRLIVEIFASAVIYIVILLLLKNKALNDLSVSIIRRIKTNVVNRND